jgi:hypothetical protein
MDLSEPAFELPREAAETFAALVDCFRDYRDCADVYSETQKLEVYDELQAHIDTLKAQGVALRYAERKLQMKSGSDQSGSKPLPFTALYVIAFPLGKEPEQFPTLTYAHARPRGFCSRPMSGTTNPNDAA